MAAGETLVADAPLCAVPFGWTATADDWTGTNVRYDASIAAEPGDWVEAVCAEAGTVACARVLELPADPPEWLELLRAGEIDARDGRSWRMDDPAAVVAATRARAGTPDLVFDYDHQTQRSLFNGQRAPASGWIKEVRLNGAGDAVEGRVEWTAEGAEKIRSREYRYYSPTFLHTRDGRVTALTGAGLTNQPAVDVPALATQENPMDETQLKALREAFGLAEGADEAAVLAACAAAAEALTGLATLRTALGVGDDADAEAMASGIAALKTRAEGGTGGEPNPNEYVPRSLFDGLQAQLRTLQDTVAGDKATAAVDAAIEAGKIAPAQRAWAEAYCATDPEGFRTFVEGAPAILTPGRSQRTEHAVRPAADAPLTAAEEALCRDLGNTPEEFMKSRKALEKRRDRETAAA